MSIAVRRRGSQNKCINTNEAIINHAESTYFKIHVPMNMLLHALCTRMYITSQLN